MGEKYEGPGFTTENDAKSSPFMTRSIFASVFLQKMWLLFMLSVLHFCGCIDYGCRLTSSELPSMSLDGDIIIGVVVPVHVDKIYTKINYNESPVPAMCKTFRLENYQRVQAVHFAVEEINKTPGFLPNITLGFQIFDSCTVLQRAVSGTLQLLSGYGRPLPNYRCEMDTRLAAVIGHSISTYTMLLAQILGLYRYPQISHFSTSSLLSNRIQFPSFFRTVPSDAFQSQGLAQLVLQFGWTWIGLVAIDNDYGQQGIQMIKRDIIKAGACVAFTETIISSQENRNAPHITRVVKESSATAVVIFSTDIDLAYVLDEMLRQNITGKVWIASEAWATSAFLSISKYSKLLFGTIGFALHSGSMPGFGKFLNRINPSMIVGRQWIKNFWEEVFDCKFQDQNFSRNTLMKECTGQERLESVQNSYNDISSLRVTYNIYTAVHVVGKALHDLGKCKKGNGPFLNGICADIKNFEPWQLLHYMKKLRLILSSGRQLFFNENGDPPASYDIVNWQLGPGGEMRQVKVGNYDTSGNSGNVFTINSSHVQWGTQGHGASGKRPEETNLCAVSSVFNVLMERYPTKPFENCLLRQVTFGVVFALCVSCILAKTVMVVIAFKATRPEVKSEGNLAVLVIQCNEGSSLAFWSMLGYLGLLAFISFTVAFLARRLPDNFNEAKYITFSMLAFLTVWLSYIPATLSSRGKYMVAMEIFAIQSSSWGLVICMFLPKCFIIVFRPGMNSREKIMAKQKNLTMWIQVLFCFTQAFYSEKLNDPKCRLDSLDLCGSTLPGEVLHYMKKTRVKLSSGRDLFFDENGDPPPIYDIVNWQMDLKGSMKQVKVGTFCSKNTHRGALDINISSIRWPFGDEKVPSSTCSESCPPGFQKASLQGEPSCCYKCVPCSHGEISNETDATECYECPWNEWPSEENDRCLQKPIEYLSYEETLGVTLASTSVSSSFVPITILGLLVCYKNTPIVRANNYTISCLLLMCLSLCFLCSLAFIGYPEYQKCLLRQVAFGMVFALCVSCILAKTILVMIVFRATKPNSELRRWASPQVSYLVICMGTIIQFLICIMWLTISPPFPEFNVKAKTGVIVIECNEGSPTAFWFTLGYLSFLAFISLLVAFLARQLPDSFNEAKFITFSMLAFLSVWVSFIPTSLSTSGKYIVAMEIFAIIFSSWAILSCLFLPKCYIILLKPHINSRKHFLGNMLY
ncbi:LOW QUALITY PROTEIN: vomeronasal type-2 receptor 1-like [Leptodactylus fuscus]|uniref:LOW QUALITY PROTEIN: vomeronasal type-2 receptor 1-like n=1 Tax=Leptodactylus fuscus TaxID=238119 RepID=UPI003F4ED298